MIPSRPPAPAAACPLERALANLDLPPGYYRRPVPDGLLPVNLSVARRCAARWLPEPGAAGRGPLVLDAVLLALDRLTDALRLLTQPPLGFERLATRDLFMPSIGDAGRAVRADVIDEGTRYVVYRVECLRGRTLVTMTAAWRWPSGSPTWLYDRVRPIVGALPREGAAPAVPLALTPGL